jgi:N-acetylglucosamine-6-sulfatase
MLVRVTTFIVAAAVLAPVESTRADPLPSVLLIMTDDQRADTLTFMEELQEGVVAPGALFTQAFAPPTCCPSRASILGGGYPHTTGIWRNMSPFGGFDSFDDSETLPVWLDRARYRTGLFGKYLNGYEAEDVAYIPPGWDRWFAFTSPNYVGWKVSNDGVLYSENSYSTEALTSEAVEFIESTRAAKPFFAFVSYKAPHSPFKPMEQDSGSFDWLPPWRPPSFNEMDTSDKPAYIAALPPLSDAEVAKIDEMRQDQHETLEAVDRGIGTLLDTLKASGRLSSTIVIFLGDNGFHWGEHRWPGKTTPYEESIHIPLAIRYDPVSAPGVVSPALVVGLDVTATILDLTGVQGSAEGMSLAPIMAGTSASGHEAIPLEYLEQRGKDAPTYCGARTEAYKYVRYITGEEELYDLARDPGELENRATDPAYAEAKATLRTTAQALCSPPPPGYNWDSQAT